MYRGDRIRTYSAKRRLGYNQLGSLRPSTTKLPNCKWTDESAGIRTQIILLKRQVHFYVCHRPILWSGWELNPTHRHCKCQSPPWYMPPQVMVFLVQQLTCLDNLQESLHSLLLVPHAPLPGLLPTWLCVAGQLSSKKRTPQIVVFSLGCHVLLSAPNDYEGGRQCHPVWSFFEKE